MLNLHEIIELENKWKTYKEKKNKKKKIIFYIFAICIIIGACISVPYYFYKKGASELKENVKNSNEQVKLIIDEQKVKLEKEKILKKQAENKEKEQKELEVKNEIVIEEEKEIKELPTFTLNTISISTANKEENKSQIIKSNIPKEIVIKNIEENKPIKNPDNIEYLKLKYNETKSIYFALDVSESYYQKDDFENARKWALIANKHDIDNEKSWILFAKSSYKLGLKEQAVESLKNYLNNSYSNDINETLELIKKGKL